MFTWVCQRCGREVDVAEVECPYCRVEGARTALGSAQGADRRTTEDIYPATAPPQPERLPLPAREPLKPPTPAPLPAPPTAFSVRPVHLLLVGLVLLASLGIAIYLARPDLVTVEGVSLPKLPMREAPPLQQGDLEVAGIRAWRDSESNLKVRAVLVNHSEGPASDLEYEVTLREPDAEEDAPPAASFEIHLEEPLGARESKEIEADLIAPEGLTALPEWNRMRVEIEPAPAEEATP